MKDILKYAEFFKHEGTRRALNQEGLTFWPALAITLYYIYHKSNGIWILS